MSTAPTPVTPVEVTRDAFLSIATGDLDRFAELLHENVVYDIVPVGMRHGRPAVRRYFEEVRRAMPDVTMTLEHVVGDDRHAAVKWHLAGTFTGTPYQGVAPNGRRIELAGIDFTEVDEGRIRHARTVFDGAGVARQIGVLPTRGSIADRAVTRAFNAKTHAADRWEERRRARRPGASRK
ncbi:ester cyclase [Streptomyces griseus]|uniref:ester cyclase n=1 Tax=Streptomyces griseus TaxID=1911 RepID=UPI0008402160|nr:ester cyclase [Streptomyces griseus]